VLLITPRGDYTLTRPCAEKADSREMDTNESLFEQICSRRRGDVRDAGSGCANSDCSGQAVTTTCSASRRCSRAGSPENESGVRNGPHELLPGPERRRGQEMLAVPPRRAVAFMRGILQGSSCCGQGKSHGRTGAREPAPRCAAQAIGRQAQKVELELHCTIKLRRSRAKFHPCARRAAARDVLPPSGRRRS